MKTPCTPENPISSDRAPSIVDNWRFLACSLEKGTFHVSPAEESLWEEASLLFLQVHACVAQTLTEIEAAGFSWRAMLLLASKGGLERSCNDKAAQDGPLPCEMDEKYFQWLEAERLGKLRRVQWSPRKFRGVEPIGGGFRGLDPSPIIASTIADRDGRLDPNTRLVLGPQLSVAQVQFDDDGEPYIVGWYEAVEVPE